MERQALRYILSGEIEHPRIAASCLEIPPIYISECAITVCRALALSALASTVGRSDSVFGVRHKRSHPLVCPIMLTDPVRHLYIVFVIRRIEDDTEAIHISGSRLKEFVSADADLSQI